MTGLHFTSERGSALVTALLVMTLLLIVGMSTLQVVDSQSRESGRERVRESSFQLTEGVLNTQIYLLSRQWPGRDAPSPWPKCSAANQLDPRCPDEQRLQSSFQAVDYEAGFSWTSEVFDNAGTSLNFYDDAVIRNGQTAKQDANGDGYLWVRSQGLVRDRRRILVALVKAEELTGTFPRAAVVAGSLAITNSGNHQYIDTNGDPNGEAGRVILRCQDASQQSCAAWDSSKGQIGPQRPEAVPSYPSALSPETIDQLRERAQANGTYFGTGCPGSLTGALVFIEKANLCRQADHNLSARQSYNSAQAPGMLVIGSGYLELKSPYYGLIYHVNGSDGIGPRIEAPNTAFKIHANGWVRGAVVIDGSAKLDVGSNSGGPGNTGNLIYDPNARNALKTFGTAGIVQNSFREISTATR